MRIVVPLAAVLGLFVLAGPSNIRAELAFPIAPRVELIAAPAVVLPGEVDSNSPAVWELIRGHHFLFVLTSAAGTPKATAGRALGHFLGQPREVSIDPWPGGGVWMEAVVADESGTWYGYYHNEDSAEACGTTAKAIPRIGAARSRDRGRTWESLGTILEAPADSHVCASMNQYFLGGVGDFSVQLDADSRYLYLFFSQYHGAAQDQGVAVARLAWAHRDEPAGRVMVWAGRTWLPPSDAAEGEDEPAWDYPAGTPIMPAATSWHDPEDTRVDAFWGPSVHWNTYLQQYVMLLNRAEDASWTQEGIYISYAPRLDDPRLWRRPVKIMDRGTWYPQVMGTEPGVGTDKLAGRTARLFVSGVSRHYIRFSMKQATRD